MRDNPNNKKLTSRVKMRQVIHPTCGIIITEVNEVQTIYIDILLCVNLVINYLLLSCASFYTHTDIKIRRLILGSAVGALCSLSILLPEIPFLANMLLKVAVGGVTVFSAFGKKRPKEFIKLFAVFLTATFFFCGIVIALWFLFTPKNLIIKNSVVYLQISPTALMIYSIICYLAFRIFNTISGRHEVVSTRCILTVGNNNGFVRVTAKIDTGNSLKEPFSQCPVIVIGRKTAQPVTPREILEYETVTTLNYRTSVNNIRFVPFTAIGGGGIMPCFKAEKVFLNDIPCDKTVYIALCNDSFITGDFQAIIPYEIV